MRPAAAVRAMTLTVGIADESRDGERRVAASPASVRALVAAEHAVVVQHGAGAASGWADDEYTAAGAAIAGSAAEVMEQASMLLCVRGSGPGAATWEGAGARTCSPGSSTRSASPRR